MGLNLILAISANAASCAFVTTGTTGTLSLVGEVTTEEVAVQIPTVEAPDVGTDAHWTALMQNGEAVKLSLNNNVLMIPAVVLVRLVKSAGVAGNAYGVQWS